MRTDMLSILLYAATARATAMNVLDGVRTQFNLPALAAGIVNPNRSVQAEAAGYRRFGTPVNATANDQFHLGSNTKAMTAVLIAKYIEQGNFTWETTLAEVLPDWRDRMQNAYQNVTIAQLTSHHSGFVETAVAEQWLIGGMTDVQALEVQYNASALEGRRLAVERAFNATPGPVETYSYCNYNYIILGFIVDTLLGPWEEQLEEVVWRPLNMTDCGYYNYPEPTPDSTEGVWPHTQGDTDPIPLASTLQYEYPTLYGPAGLARCSPSSYAKFLTLQLDGARGRDTPVLRASSFARLHTSYRNSSDQEYTPGGWLVLTADDPPIGRYLAHDGSNNYNYASALVLLELDTAIFAFTNMAGSDPVTNSGRRGISAVTERLVAGDLSDMLLIEEGTASINGSGGGLEQIDQAPSSNDAARKQTGSFIVIAICLVVFNVFS